MMVVTEMFVAEPGLAFNAPLGAAGLEVDSACWEQAMVTAVSNSTSVGISLLMGPR
jgi:hypothetical protein